MSEKIKIKIIFGEQATDYAADYGEKKALAKLKKGELSGEIREYELDTVNDEQVLIQALADFDGWMGYWVCN